MIKYTYSHPPDGVSAPGLPGHSVTSQLCYRPIALPKGRARAILAGMKERRERLTKILDLRNDVQAQLVDAILNDEGIPHLVVSYRDPAYSTIFQVVRGWGHLEAPESYRSQIEQILDDLENAETIRDDDDDDGPFND